MSREHYRHTLAFFSPGFTSMDVRFRCRPARPYFFAVRCLGFACLMTIAPLLMAESLGAARQACVDGDAAEGLALLAVVDEQDAAYWQVVARCQAVAGNRDKQRAALSRADAAAAAAGDSAAQVALAPSMAELKFAQGEIEAAIYTLDSAIATALDASMEDALPGLMLTRGNLLARAGQYAVAEEQFREIIDSDGAFVSPATVTDARLNRARALLRLQRAQDAEGELEAARTALKGEQAPAWRAPSRYVG